MKIKYLLAIFIPAILIAALALFVRFIQYEPQTPAETETLTTNTGVQIPIYPDDPVLGSKKAPISIIAFEDFGCDGCRTQSALINSMMQKYPNKIKVIWKGLVVTKFPVPTDLAHQYGFCANKQGKFNEFSQLAFANGNNLTQTILDAIAKEIKLDDKDLAECLNSGAVASYMSKNEQLGMALNIQSVPTFFLNNKQINPPQILEGWEAVLGL